MNKNFISRVLFSISILFIGNSMTFGQVPDDVNGRLWRLCQVWGFAKYFHENNCDANWNSILLTAIDSILESNSNASFNKTIAELLDAAGPIPHATEPLIIEADINVNAHFDWMQDSQFSPEVIDIFDSILVNFRPKENCFVKIADPFYPGYLDFSNDSILNIPNFSYSIESNRLLILFYYWNIINYFHADKGMMDQDWDSTLFQFIPLIREDQNETEFQLDFLKLVTYLNDSHGFTISTIMREYFGTHFAFIKTGWIENQTVITKLDPAVSGIAVGDIVKKINGLDANLLRDSLAQYTQASNSNILQWNIDNHILAGPFGSLLTLELEDSTGMIYSKSLKRKYSNDMYNEWVNVSSYPAWEITPCGYGYVNMGNITYSQVPQMYDELKDLPAIIFDVRNYPPDIIFDLIPLLFPGPFTWALLTKPDPSYPGWYNWTNNREQSGFFSNPSPYQGKVIILASARTISSAEYTIMALQQHPNAFTIGNQTGGADGDVSNIALPGIYRTNWTSLGIFYPDTTTAQRVGVRIDSIVTPTIEGIRKGKDEVLEAALDCLINSSTETNINQELNVFPNPVSKTLNFELESDWFGEFRLEIYNSLGQAVYRTIKTKTDDIQVFHENLNHLPTGTYIMVISSADESYTSKFIVL